MSSFFTKFILAVFKPRIKICVNPCASSNVTVLINFFHFAKDRSKAITLKAKEDSTFLVIFRNVGANVP